MVGGNHNMKNCIKRVKALRTIALEGFFIGFPMSSEMIAHQTQHFMDTAWEIHWSGKYWILDLIVNSYSPSFEVSGVGAP